MITIEKKHAIHTFSPDHPAAAAVPSGETVVFETYDCYMGQLLEPGTTFADVDRKLGNPATGPLFVEGAEKGDVLKVEILEILLDSVGILDIGPGSGCLGRMFREYVIRRLPVKDNLICYNELQIPARPMVGVIGVAPEQEAVSTMTPKNHGGNMDCTKIEAGSALYLPVKAPGALLAMGDLHAIMGDGEAGNCGVEIGGRVTVRVSVLKGLALEYPVIENSSQWITVAYGDTMDQACERCTLQMYEFLTGYAGIGGVDAGMYIDMLGSQAVCQIVNPCKTVRMEMDKWIVSHAGFQGFQERGL